MLIDQIKQYMSTNVGYTKKQYYKMVADKFGISQNDAKEYVVFVIDNRIGVNDSIDVGEQ